MKLTIDEEKLKKASLQWVRQNKKKIKQGFCSVDKFPSERNPVTIFMAGTPGAGKTEFSKSLLATFPKPMVRIDADEIREMMREIGYNGANAHIYQTAAGNAVSNLYGSILNNKQSALIDGTFAYGNWRENVERSIKENRLVDIYYLYQDPIIAWEFVKKREEKQGRHVPLEVFLNDYFSAMENVKKAKEIFEKKITVYFAKNNYKKKLEYLKMDVWDIEKYVPKMYTKEELIKCLR